MSLNSSRSKLTALTRELAANWHQTREFWVDAKSHEFEEKYLQGLLASVNTACTNIEALDRILAKVRNDCE